MGLDITYGSKIVVPQGPVNEDSEDESGEYYYSAYNHEHYVDRAADLKVEHFQVDGSEGFRAGSYGGYNRWRRWLAQIAGYPSKTMNDGISDITGPDVGCWLMVREGKYGPLWKLIDFTDCEGVIGPTVAGELFEEMTALRNQAEKFGDEYELSLFDKFLAAFDAARKGGVVIFH